ncbi:Golgin candidate 5 [Picochlorum sp. SENEW3]|nr:Golgin candidate 5 [Picochlorum sp. SENEW3]
MSGFGFGGFDISNITNVSNIGETLQKIREDVENTIDASFQDDVEEGHDQGNDDAEGWFGGFDGIVKSFVGDEEEEEQTATELPREETQQQVALSQAEKLDETQPVHNTPDEQKVVFPRDDDRAEPQAVAEPVGAVEDQALSVARREVADGVAEKVPQDPSTTVTHSSKSSKKKKKKKNKGQAKAVDTLPPEQQAALAQTDADSDMAKRVAELERTLKVREEQLGRQAEEIAEAKRISDQLMKKNEELAMAKASVSEKDVADVETKYESQLDDAKKKMKQLGDQKAALESKLQKVVELEQKLEVKDTEIREILEEGEKLSKKQLHMETTIKQLRQSLTSAKSESEEQAALLESERSQAAVLRQEMESLQSQLNVSKEDHDTFLANLKTEHEKTVRELRTELIAAERKMENMEKAGASRKLRDAESKCEALQESIESLREEMRRQRENADEREDMLSAEISLLQQRCAEAEARQQDSQDKLPQATAPLYDEIEALRGKLEEQEQESIAVQKKLMSQVDQLEKENESLKTRLESVTENEQEIQSRYDTIHSQLMSAQQASVESERIASVERAARDEAELALREAKSELSAMENSVSSMEKVYNKQIENMAKKESSLNEKIRQLEDQVETLKGQAATQAPISPPKTIPEALGKEEETSLTLDLSEHSLQKKIKDLESTRDRLSNELVQAEQRVAEGIAAKTKLDGVSAEVSTLRKKLAAATELLGEREERIEELRADLQDIKEGYKQQLVIMADECTRLNKKVAAMTSM